MVQYIFCILCRQNSNYTFSGIQQKYYWKIIGNMIQKIKLYLIDPINISEVNNIAISIFLLMWFQREYFMNDV